MSSSNSLPASLIFRVLNMCAHVAERPDAERIVGGDEAERPCAQPLQPARQQHAERLVRQPALERIGDHVEAVAVRKVSTRRSPRFGSTDLSACSVASRPPVPAAPSSAWGQPACRAPGRRDKWKAKVLTPARFRWPAAAHRHCKGALPRSRNTDTGRSHFFAGLCKCLTNTCRTSCNNCATKGKPLM